MKIYPSFCNILTLSVQVDELKQLWPFVVWDIMLCYRGNHLGYRISDALSEILDGINNKSHTSDQTKHRWTGGHDLLKMPRSTERLQNTGPTCPVKCIAMFGHFMILSFFNILLHSLSLK